MANLARLCCYKLEMLNEGKAVNGKDDYMNTDMDFASKVHRRTYATTLDEQLEQLNTDEMLTRFTESRKQLSLDPYRPIYHFVNPEGMLNDPNGLCVWKGRVCRCREE